MNLTREETDALLNPDATDEQRRAALSFFKTRAAMQRYHASGAVHATRSTPIRAKLDASKDAGRNNTERVISCMRRCVQGFAALSWAEQVERAAEAMRAGVVNF